VQAAGKKTLALLLFVASLFCSAVSRADTDPGWELGVELELGEKTRALGDGRLLTCFDEPAALRCELIDPLTAERRPAVVMGPKALDSALTLSDGRLLLPAAEQIIDPESGTTHKLPPPGRRLDQMIGMPLAGGRAAFRAVDSEKPGAPARLLLFLGAERGFRELEAGPAGTRVKAVFDLEDGRLLIARGVARSGGGEDLEFVLYGIEDRKWQRGARIPGTTPLAAFRSDERIVVVIALGSGSRQALFLDRDGGSPRFESIRQASSTHRAARLGREQVLLWDSYESVLWDARRGVVATAPLIIPVPNGGLALERSDRFVVVDERGRAFLWSADRPPPETPCADVFDYLEVVTGSPRRGRVDSIRLQKMLNAPHSKGCVEHLERQRRLPEFLSAPLERLAAAGKGPADEQQDDAAKALCVLSPTFSATLIARINRPGMLREGLNHLCTDASEQIPVLAAARARHNVGETLARTAFLRNADGDWIRRWVVPLLATRPDIAREGARLLLLAHEKRAFGFDALRKTLCSKTSRGEVARACQRTAGESEDDFGRNRKLYAALPRLGIATAVAGGLGTLAYVGRNNNLGRGIAVGSGTAGGAALAGLLTIGATSGGDTRGMLGVLLIIPMSMLGAVGGGFAAAKLAEKPGMQRFATAAVPLSAALATGIVLTLDDL
jgi:hypothetical protein